MNYFDAAILGAVQGITEFLPISSSGHLILAESYLELDVATLKSFDIVVHLGTLLAILIYFKAEVLEMAKACLLAVSGRGSWNDPAVRLVWYIFLATLPAIALALTLADYIDSIFRNPTAVLTVMIFVGLFFLFSEWRAKSLAKTNVGGWKRYFVIGVAQAIAIIPGISRSGSTISTGLLMKMERSDSAKFSFLLGIPAIFGAGVLAFKDLSNGEPQFGVGVLIIGFLAAFIFGMISISFLMRFLKKYSLAVFAFYLIVLGVGGLMVGEIF